MVMVPLVDTVGVVSSPLSCSCGGVNVTDVQAPGMEEPNGRNPCVE
jgi:hypothetical protein